MAVTGGQLLNALEANSICRPYVRGVYMIDTVHDFEKYIDLNAKTNLCLINTGNLFLPSGVTDKQFTAASSESHHWLLLCISDTAKAVFFDSFDKSPDYYSKQLKPFIDRFSTSCQFAPYRIQADHSQLCGLFVLQVCELLCTDFHTFKERFEKTYTREHNSGRNEHIAQSWFYQRYSIRFSEFLKGKQLTTVTYARLPKNGSASNH